MSTSADSQLLARPLRLHTLSGRVLELPLSQPLVTGAGTFDRRRLMLVRATVDCGGERHAGYGEVAPLPGWSEETVDDSLQVLESLDVPRDLDSATELGQAIPELADRSVLHAGIELAVLDALSRAAGQTLGHTLKGDRQGDISASVPVQYTLGALDVEETCRRVSEAATIGYTVCKLKVGAASAREDLERVEAVLARCPEMRFRLDANGAWSVETALAMLRRLPAERVELIEQPVDRRQFQRLLDRWGGQGPGIAADESCVNRQDALHWLGDGRVSALVVKPSALGGLLAASRLIEQALAARMGVIISNLMESAVGRLAAAHLAAAWPQLPGPHGLATGAWFSRDVLAGGEHIAAARLLLPDGPGIGFDPAIEH
jgi:L-Ala-D/L-Glu epimerase